MQNLNLLLPQKSNKAKKQSHRPHIVERIDGEFDYRDAERLYVGKQRPAPLQASEHEIVPAGVEVTNKPDELTLGTAMKKTISEQHRPSAPAVSGHDYRLKSDD